MVSLGVSRSHSFVPGQQSGTDEVIQARPAPENSQSEPLEQSHGEILPLTPQSLVGSPSISDSSFKKVNKRILIELMKGKGINNKRGKVMTWLSNVRLSYNFKFFSAFFIQFLYPCFRVDQFSNKPAGIYERDKCLNSPYCNDTFSSTMVMRIKTIINQGRVLGDLEGALA